MLQLDLSPADTGYVSSPPALFDLDALMDFLKEKLFISRFRKCQLAVKIQ